MGIIEKYNKEITNERFIKSFNILNHLKISPTKKMIIELILSYQSNEQDFYMNYSDIASRLNLKRQSIKDNICALKKLGYILTVNTSNYNGKNGGSSTSIKVNEDIIVDELKKIKEIDKSSIKSSGEERVEVVSVLYEPKIIAQEIKTQDEILENGIFKPLPKEFFISKNNCINFEDTLSYFFEKNEINKLKELHNINIHCPTYIITTILLLHDKNEKTQFVELFNSVQKIVKTTMNVA